MKGRDKHSLWQESTKYSNILQTDKREMEVNIL